MHQCTIDSAKHSSPNSKISGNNWWTCFDWSQAADLKWLIAYSISWRSGSDCITVIKVTHKSSRKSRGCVSETFDSLEDSSTYAAHGESTSTVVNDAIRTGFSSVFLHFGKNLFILRKKHIAGRIFSQIYWNRGWIWPQSSSWIVLTVFTRTGRLKGQKETF